MLGSTTTYSALEFANHVQLVPTPPVVHRPLTMTSTTVKYVDQDRTREQDKGHVIRVSQERTSPTMVPTQASTILPQIAFSVVSVNLAATVPEPVLNAQLENLILMPPPLRQRTLTWCRVKPVSPGLTHLL